MNGKNYYKTDKYPFLFMAFLNNTNTIFNKILIQNIINDIAAALSSKS